MSALLDGLPIGILNRTRGRTLVEGECALLTDLTWTIGRFHSEQEFAETTTFGGVVFAGALAVAVAMGLINTSDWYSDLSRFYGFKVVAALGMDVRYRHPFRAGDTMRVESTMVSARESSGRSERGVAEFEDRVLNQRGEVIAELHRHWLFERIPVQRQASPA
jgi:acyl dehydratase